MRKNPARPAASAPYRLVSDLNAPPDPSPARALAPLDGSLLSSAEVLATLGEGKRSRVFRIRWQSAEYALKLYDPAAAAKHLGRHPLPLARYEYRRNRGLYDTPGLRDHIAKPIAFLDHGPVQAFVQAFTPGVLFDEFRKTADAPTLRALTDSLPKLVALAHGAGVYDLDLHPNNVMVVTDAGGRHRLVFFDFNNIPAHERSPNPLSALLMALRVIRRESRDLRRLHLFTDPPGINRLGTRRQK